MDSTLGMLTLGTATWMVGLLSVGFLFCSVLLILTVLIQRPQGGGLSGAFGGGGAGSGETAFGARTGDALTIATISFFVLWLVVAVGLVWVMQPPGPGSARPQATSTDKAALPENQGATTESPSGTPTETSAETPAGTPTETPAEPGTQPGAEQPAGEQPAGEQPADATPPGDAQTGGGAGDGSSGGGGR